ncbi:hypothetical protein A0256_05660 [Mucilaginibacter sp. PAMC 26640]|nr:hypothetical protein A0256_05660 [Mucilaginibacter sp. PAMC 26640]
MRYPVVIVRFLNVSGMALWPFILVSDSKALNDEVVLNHERIHLRQQAELLVIPFYVLYLLNYLCNLAIYRQHYKAYFNIVFEREAYQKETEMTYLSSRKWYSWAKFF